MTTESSVPDTAKAIQHLRSALEFLQPPNEGEVSTLEDLDSDRREAKEDIELALLALGVDVYAPLGGAS